MAFPDYDQLVEPLALPLRGKLYVLPELGINDTVRLNLALDSETDDVMDGDEMEQLLLGDAANQMRADNVPTAFFDRVFKTAVTEFRYGREMAEQMWATGGVAPKDASTVPASEPSPSTDEATSTPSPAPTSGTRTSRRKPAPSTEKTPE